MAGPSHRCCGGSTRRPDATVGVQQAGPGPGADAQAVAQQHGRPVDPAERVVRPGAQAGAVVAEDVVELHDRLGRSARPSEPLVLADSGLEAVMEPWSPSGHGGSGRRACWPTCEFGRLVRDGLADRVRAAGRPTLAAVTAATASHCSGLRNSSSTSIATIMAAAGSRLIRMLNTPGRIRRKATRSAAYGITELSRPTATPRARMCGSSRSEPPAGIANGVRMAVATTLAMASPSRPGQRAPVCTLNRMYAAHAPPATRAKATPHPERSVSRTWSRPIPTAARATHSRSRGRLLITTARVRVRRTRWSPPGRAGCGRTTGRSPSSSTPG